VLLISSACGSVARTLSALTLVAILTGCQGLVSRNSGGPAPHGTLSASPASLPFGNVVVGQKASLKGTLTAAGATVAISSVTSTSGEFAVSGITFPASVDSGQSLSFTVTFTPQTSGAASGTLSFLSNADDSPAQQLANGTGIAAPQHSVDLSWTGSQSAGVVGYNVYRGTGGPYSRINGPLEASISYTDSLVSAGSTYFYVVTAVDGNGAESAYSEQAQALIPTP
jgi:hypothetical protein